MMKILKRYVLIAVTGIALSALAALPVIKGSYPYYDLVAFNGIATGSLPGCAAGVAAGEGWLAFDTTTNTMKVCNGTAWGNVGPDIADISGDLLPSVDNSYDIGSGTKAWDNLFINTIQDNTASARIDFTPSNPTTYSGDATNGIGSVAHTVNNLAAINAGNDRFVMRWYRDNGSNLIARLDTNGNMRNGVTDFAVPVVHGTNAAAAKDIEVGSAAMTASELAVTFTTAFGVAPVCVCTHVNTTNDAACNIKTGAAPSTTGVTFAVAAGGTDVVHWHCIGAR